MYRQLFFNRRYFVAVLLYLSWAPFTCKSLNLFSLVVGMDEVSLRSYSANDMKYGESTWAGCNYNGLAQ